ncbi:hypothetical protein P7K49_023006, partial [Saguinus oedipus]
MVFDACKNADSQAPPTAALALGRGQEVFLKHPGEANTGGGDRGSTLGPEFASGLHKAGAGVGHINWPLINRPRSGAAAPPWIPHGCRKTFLEVREMFASISPGARHTVRLCRSTDGNIPAADPPKPDLDSQCTDYTALHVARLWSLHRSDIRDERDWNAPVDEARRWGYSAQRKRFDKNVLQPVCLRRADVHDHGFGPEYHAAFLFGEWIPNIVIARRLLMDQEVVEGVEGKETSIV